MYWKNIRERNFPTSLNKQNEIKIYLKANFPLIELIHEHENVFFESASVLLRIQLKLH